MDGIDNIRILAVDDRPENLTAIEAVLDEPGIALTCVTSATEAFEQLLKDDFALVLLDVQMPRMDGYEMAEMMRQHPRIRNIPIILITAIDRSEKQLFRGYESGAVDFIFKPIDPFILKTKVRVFCELYRLRKDAELQAAALADKNKLLEERLGEIHRLRGMLPICASCKKVRNDTGYWEEIETYFRRHSDTEFSHGYCPECAERLYPSEPPSDEE